jgi:acetylornithine/N-succinyldiaminopimelate aminotransferase
MLARREVSCFQPGDQGGTFCGHPLMTAVGLAVLRALTQSGFLATVQLAAAHLRTGLLRVGGAHGASEVRGRGLLLALVLPEAKAPEVVQAALRHGLLLNAPQPNLLRFMPQLNVTHDEIDSMLRRLDHALAEVWPGAVAPPPVVSFPER